jgi:hypothetical protein
VTPTARIAPVTTRAGRKACMQAFGGRAEALDGQMFWNALEPDGAATVAAQLQVNPLFPK